MSTPSTPNIGRAFDARQTEFFFSDAEIGGLPYRILCIVTSEADGAGPCKIHARLQGDDSDIVEDELLVQLLQDDGIVWVDSREHREASWTRDHSAKHAGDWDEVALYPHSYRLQALYRCAFTALMNSQSYM